MKLKWSLLVAFVILYALGIVGIAWHTYGATDPSKATPSIEVVKVVFIMLGGLGVVLPTYLNIWQSLETARLLQDQVRRTTIENTFHLLERWDDKSLVEARAFTRGLKDQYSSMSPDEIKDAINKEPNLRHSVILLFNYFELIRISIQNQRVDPNVVSASLGDIFHDVYKHFEPWIMEQPSQYQEDLRVLSALIPKSISRR